MTKGRHFFQLPLSLTLGSLIHSCVAAAELVMGLQTILLLLIYSFDNEFPLVSSFFLG